MSHLNGMVAIVTGASSGIGRASALALASKGVKIVGAALDQDQLDTLVADIEAAGGTAKARVTDVADRDCRGHGKWLAEAQEAAPSQRSGIGMEALQRQTAGARMRLLGASCRRRAGSAWGLLQAQR